MGIISSAMKDPNAPTTTTAIPPPSDPSQQAMSGAQSGGPLPPVPNQSASAGASQTTTPDYTAQANAMYQNTLGRQGDANGVQYWATQLASGKNPNDVQNDFVTSAKQVYHDYLTDPNSQYSKDANI